MTETVEQPKDNRERLAAGERVLSLSEAAEILHMKRPNVVKFLARRGVEPAFPKAQGYFWWASDIERVKEEREQDPTRMAADARRRASARARLREEAAEPPPETRTLGQTQQELMLTMLVRPVQPGTNAARMALRRLAARGLAERIEEGGPYQLTSAGRALAAELNR